MPEKRRSSRKSVLPNSNDFHWADSLPSQKYPIRRSLSPEALATIGGVAARAAELFGAQRLAPIDNEGLGLTVLSISEMNKVRIRHNSRLARMTFARSMERIKQMALDKEPTLDDPIEVHLSHFSIATQRLRRGRGSADTQVNELLLMNVTDPEGLLISHRVAVTAAIDKYERRPYPWGKYNAHLTVAQILPLPPGTSTEYYAYTKQLNETFSDSTLLLQGLGEEPEEPKE
ncbi:MAG TPA: hypothetical protein VLF91_00725 [Candidatus Saccharimonadales bacterium]|nr:hypothetical protein [Candidatus Saccharimonadales bacterium]